MHPARLWPVLLALALACKTAPPVTPVPPVEKPAAPDPDLNLPAEVDALRGEAKALLVAQSQLYWNSWVNGDPVDLSATYAGHEKLFTVESYEKIRRLEAHVSDPAHAHALDHLRVYFAGEYLAAETDRLSEGIAHLAATASFAVDKEELHYRDLEALLAKEPDAARRRKLMTAAAPVVRRLTALLVEKDKRTQALLANLGYHDYFDFAQDLREMDLADVAKLADELLDKTDQAYRRGLAALAKQRLGLELADVRQADIPRLFRPEQEEPVFGKDQMVPRVHALFANVGLDLAAIPGLHLDEEARSRKSPRPLCLPVEVPTDVRLSVKPRAGAQPFAQLLHEAGHAAYFGLNRANAWEFQQLGNAVLPEAYGLLFEDLVAEPGLLTGWGMAPEAQQAFREERAVKELYEARRDAALLLFGIAWYGNPTAPRARMYEVILERAVGFPLEPDEAERYALEHEDFFHSGDRLRARVLAAQIGAALTAQANGPWWQQATSGARLRELFAQGSERRPRDIAALLKVDPMDFGALVKELTAPLERPAAEPQP